MTTAIIDADFIPYLAAGSADVEKRYYTVEVEDKDSPLATFRYKKEALAWAQDKGLTEQNLVHHREVVDEATMYHYIDTEIGEITRLFDNYVLCIGGEGNFREKIYPEYKSKRTSRPALIKEAKQYMLDEWNSQVIQGMEADDAVAIFYNEIKDSVLVSPDKDLNQVAGLHYDPIKKFHFHIPSEEAIKFLYMQILQGDATDGIPGLKGYGAKKSARALEDLETEQELWERCLELYEDEDAANLTANLVYILRTRGDSWQPPLL